MNARFPIATTTETASMGNANAAEVTLDLPVNKWTVRILVALAMASVCQEHVSAGRAGVGPIATKWMTMKNSAFPIARATGASKLNWASASATEDSLGMIALSRCAILIVGSEATAKVASVFAT